MNSTEIKKDLAKRGDAYYENALNLYERGDYTQSMNSLKRSFDLNSFNLQSYLLKCELLKKMNDYEGAKAILEKLLGVISAWTTKEDTKYDEIKTIAIEKIVECYLMQGHRFWNVKEYNSAYEAFCNALRLKPCLEHSIKMFETVFIKFCYFYCFSLFTYIV
jgi:tetratricopeptide (TPR) repeat protein